ncbi:MAG: molecular chaperone TorD family protein, partial [Hyphomicrobiales bacterium]|nr:molecular chaperone TorD family protein [Hyphomicrobiales bacterium]
MLRRSTEPEAAMNAAPTRLDPPRPTVDRALAYGWLSALFARELDAEGLAAYAGAEWRPLLDALAGDTSLEPAVAALRALPADDPETLALDLAVTYARLFHGVDGPNSVPPYESAYVSPRGTLFQAPVSEVNALIARLDLSLSRAYAEPSDHVAVELA